MAFDSVRGVSLYFDGATDPVSTWEWDGNAWTSRGEGGPPPRENHGLVFDSRRGVVVLFGGIAFGVRFTDTWEWNGSTWALRSSNGPLIPEGFQMAFDSVRGVSIVLSPQAIWEWDGTTWTDTKESPRLVTNPAFAFDSIRGEAVVFGGQIDTNMSSNETWIHSLRTNDGDQDGVADPCDSCERTIPDIPVDGEGCPESVRGDSARDGDIDLADFSAGLLCWGLAPLTSACEVFDIDGDALMTTSDVAEFVLRMQGPNVPAVTP